MMNAAAAIKTCCSDVWGSGDPVFMTEDEYDHLLEKIIEERLAMANMKPAGFAAKRPGNNGGHPTEKRPARIQPKTLDSRTNPQPQMPVIYNDSHQEADLRHVRSQDN